MIYIALGANLPSKYGTPRQTLKRAIAEIGRRGMRVTAQSHIYLTEPIPVSSQPWYHNAVISVETDMAANDVLQTLHHIEADFGRVRKTRNEARVIDLDLLDYRGQVSNVETLQLPHPRMTERAFVLDPLFDIAPNWKHPVTSMTLGRMLAQFPDPQSVMRDTMPEIMGIINVTPDSFSDGGEFLSADKAIEQGHRLVQQGARYLDIGGESSRPGSKSVGVDEELRRILPVIRGLKDCGAVLSIDTYHSETMREVLKENVGMINDITALEGDLGSLSVLQDSDCLIALMHMQGTPATMQENPYYDDVLVDILRYLRERVDYCVSNGISRDRLIVDPGIGFGKTLEHNVTLVRHLEVFHELGLPVMVGASRKTFLGQLASRNASPSERVAASLASSAAAIHHRADIVRVHNVPETRQFMDVYSKICV